MKINIEKINEVCGQEVFKPEDFQESRFDWFSPQDRHDSELREYETRLVSKKIEIALLEVYKTAASSDTERGNAYFGVEGTQPKDFDLLNLHQNDNRYISIPLEEEYRLYGPGMEKRYTRIQLRESFWNDAAIEFRAGEKVFENLGFKRILHMDISSPSDSFQSKSYCYYKDIVKDFAIKFNALRALISADRLIPGPNIGGFSYIKSSKCFRDIDAANRTVDHLHACIDQAKQLSNLDQDKQQLPFASHSGPNEINYELKKLHSIIVEEMQQEKAALIRNIDAYIFQLKSEAPLNYDEFKQKTLAEREVEKARKEAQEARELAEKRAKDKKDYDKLMLNLSSSGYGLEEMDSKGKEKKAHFTEAKAQKAAIKRSVASGEYITVYSKSFRLVDGTDGYGKTHTFWFLTSNKSVTKAA